MTPTQVDPRPVPPVLRTATVARPLEQAFAVFTERIGAWWPLPTHGVFGPRAGGVRFTGDRLVEIAVDGTESTWAEVLVWEPPTRLVLAWHPGRADGPASRVEISFVAVDSGTRVEIRHDGWEQFGRDGSRRRRAHSGPNAWGYVLDHLADLTDPREDGPDVTALGAAYDALFAEAERGGFEPPEQDAWNGEQVIAHVALNDLAMSAVGHALIHGQEPTFENHTCQDRANLAAVVAAYDDLSALVAFGRACAAQAMAVLTRLDEDQRGHAVPCRMEHDGAVVVDEPRAWGTIALDLQAGMHLPAHLAQLRDLRPSPTVANR